ncbi:pyridoxamine 5'-phosphate oxidase family protein [Pseudonocardia acidicola]|uniref:pyridoxamine 5'-phosphate oxidase family protein n=1 Tax=Pseudonocardia acidicola TaxID=2724939 RepID=UPI003084138B
MPGRPRGVTVAAFPATVEPDAAPTEPTGPGSAGEHALQRSYGTEERADRFYAEQMRDRLLPRMVEFIGRMEMLFVASADGRGECDASLRAGPPGFIRVLDDRTLAYPEYRGNGVHASLGNISENAHLGLLMIDFVKDLIGLHVNGTARIVDDATFRTEHPQVHGDQVPGRRAERWVVVEVEEAYIHCRKHIPRMERVMQRREWGTDDPARKGGDYFHAKGTPVALPGPPRRTYAAPRRPFPSTTHLGAGAARTLRPRGSAGSRRTLRA